MKLDLGHFALDMSRLFEMVRSHALDTKKREAAWRAFRDRCDKDVGFFDLPDQIDEASLQEIVSKTHALRQNFEGAIVIGIGGSHLGPTALIEALSTSTFPIFWISNVDSFEMEKAEKFAKARKAATIVISKSGNTTETLSAFFHLSPFLDKRGYVFITDPKQGELRRLAKELEATSFPVPPNVGGRFSVLSHVGLVPAALAGLDPRRIVRGAQQTRRALDVRTSENPACFFAEALYLADTKLKLQQQYLMPYTLGLKRFAEWYVQLWGESLGKMKVKERVGPTPIAAVGSMDQHSILQLLKDGPLNKVVGFVDVLQHHKSIPISKPAFSVPNFSYLFSHSFDDLSHQACLATKESLERAGVATYRIEIRLLREEVMGALFLFYETACAYSGELYGIDAFGQPGVEEMKVLLRKSL